MSSSKDSLNPGLLSYAPGLTLQIAKKMLDAGEKEAERIGCPMVIAIADSGGNLLALNRMEEALLASIQIAQDKAYTAVMGKMPTLFWKGQYDTGELVPLFFHNRWITFAGGFPIITDDKILGGIGVSGGRLMEDTSVARAALKAGGFRIKETDDIIAAATKGAHKE